MKFFNILDNSNNNSNTFNTIQNVRLDIVGELEAIIQYENHITQSNDKTAQNTWKHIVEEEQKHVGELFGLLFTLDPQSKKQFELGLKEFKEENNQ